MSSSPIFSRFVRPSALISTIGSPFALSSTSRASLLRLRLLFTRYTTSWRARSLPGITPEASNVCADHRKAPATRPYAAGAAAVSRSSQLHQGPYEEPSPPGRPRARHRRRALPSAHRPEQPGVRQVANPDGDGVVSATVSSSSMMPATAGLDRCAPRRLRFRRWKSSVAPGRRPDRRVVHPPRWSRASATSLAQRGEPRAAAPWPARGGLRWAGPPARPPPRGSPHDPVRRVARRAPRPRPEP